MASFSDCHLAFMPEDFSRRSAIRCSISRSRAFDLLLVLLERRDRVVSKEELIKLVWAGRVVDEGNLTVHIAAPEGSFKPWWHQLRIETLGWNSTTHELTSAATKTKLQQSTKSPNSPWTATIPQPTTATDLTLR